MSINNIDDLLNSPELVAPKKFEDKVIKRLQFRLFGRLFRFDCIKEGFEPPHLLAPVDHCQSSPIANWVCNINNDPEYTEYKKERYQTWLNEQQESRERMQKPSIIKNNECK